MTEYKIGDTFTFIQNKQFDLAIGELTFLLSDEEGSPDLISTLYLNRGTLYFAAGRLTEAYDDMERSLEYNHLNYPAYFNEFSLFAVKKHHGEALKNLCCGLSCLYLLRGKIHRNESDLTKAIKYSENNLEARLLKGILNMEKKKYKLALNEINWAIQIQPYNEKLQEIKARIVKLLENEGKSPSKFGMLEDSTHKNSGTDQFGTEEKPSLRLKSTAYDDVDEDFDLLAEIQKRLEDFNELYRELNGFNSALLSTQPMIHLLHNQKEEHMSLPNKPMTKSYVDDSIEEERMKISGKKKEVMFEKIPETESMEGSSSNIPQEDPGYNDTYLLTSQSKSEQYSETPENNSTYTLQAQEEGKSISIRIHNIEISEKTMKDLYCIFDYGTKEGQPKFNESFEADLEDEPQILRIRVYNKQYFSFNDTFLGEGNKEITMTGRIEVPIFLVKGEDKVNTGIVYLDIKFK